MTTTITITKIVITIINNYNNNSNYKWRHDKTQKNQKTISDVKWSYYTELVGTLWETCPATSQDSTLATSGPPRMDLHGRDGHRRY